MFKRGQAEANKDSKLNPNLSQQRYAKQSKSESVYPSNNQQKNDPNMQNYGC